MLKGIERGPNATDLAMFYSIHGYKSDVSSTIDYTICPRSNRNLAIICECREPQHPENLWVERSRVGRFGLTEWLTIEPIIDRCNSISGTIGEPMEPQSSYMLASADLETQFQEHKEKWRNETAVHSSITMKAMHPSYQRIIGMGPQVLPLIMRELRNNPDHWFWALNAITGENPVPPEDAGYIDKMTKAWLDYGKRQGFI